MCVCVCVCVCVYVCVFVRFRSQANIKTVYIMLNAVYYSQGISSLHD